jgi:hypothetical protein
MITEPQLKAVYEFSSRLKSECPGCQVTNFQSLEKEGVEILVRCADAAHLDWVCELSIEVGDEYGIAIVPTPV